MFSWTPSEAQVPGEHSVTVRVTDDGDPVLDDFETITITVAPTGLWFPTMLYPPSILSTPDEEIKLMSTAAGGIIDVRETAEEKGMFYWMQIDQ